MATYTNTKLNARGFAAMMVAALAAAPFPASGQMALVPGPGNPIGAGRATAAMMQQLNQNQNQNQQQQDQYRQFQQYQQQQKELQLAREKQLEAARERENQKLWREAMQEEREEEHQEEQQAMQKQLQLRQQQLRQQQLQNATRNQGIESSGVWGVVQEAIEAARIRIMYLLLVPALLAFAFTFKWLHGTAVKQQWKLPSMPSMPVIKIVTSPAAEKLSAPEAAEAEACWPQPEKLVPAKLLPAPAPAPVPALATATAAAAATATAATAAAKPSENTPIYLYEGTMRKYGSLDELHGVLDERVRGAQLSGGCVVFAVGGAPPGKLNLSGCVQQ